MDRYIFRNFEAFRSGVEFKSGDMVLQMARDYIGQRTAAELLAQMRELEHHMDHVLRAEGDYT